VEGGHTVTVRKRAAGLAGQRCTGTRRMILMTRNSKFTSTRTLCVTATCAFVMVLAVSCSSTSSSATNETASTSSTTAAKAGTAAPRFTAPVGADHITVTSVPGDGYVLQFYVGGDGPFMLAVQSTNPLTPFARLRASSLASGAVAVTVNGASGFQDGCTTGQSNPTSPSGDAGVTWELDGAIIKLSAPLSKDCAYESARATAIRTMAETVTLAADGQWYEAN